MRAVLIGAFLLALGCNNGDGKGQAQKAGPSPTKEGVEWSTKELVDHLQAKGIDCIVIPASTSAGLRSKENEEEIVLVDQVPTPQEAKDKSSGLRMNNTGHHWGRFIISNHSKTSTKLFDSIKAVLE
jgi:hypothetical protein